MFLPPQSSFSEASKCDLEPAGRCSAGSHIPHWHRSSSSQHSKGLSDHPSFYRWGDLGCASSHSDAGAEAEPEPGLPISSSAAPLSQASPLLWVGLQESILISFWCGWSRSHIFRNAGLVGRENLWDTSDRSFSVGFVVYLLEAWKISLFYFLSHQNQGGGVYSTLGWGNQF